MSGDIYWFALFVACNALLLLMLGVNVSRLRISLKIPFGDGDNKAMKQAIRTHGNGVEHCTIFGMAVLALSLLGANATLQASLVIVFTGARLLHAYGMLSRVFNARRVGAGLTFLLQGLAVIALFMTILAV